MKLVSYIVSYVSRQAHTVDTENQNTTTTVKILSDSVDHVKSGDTVM
jgi:hypothetical protein